MVNRKCPGGNLSLAHDSSWATNSRASEGQPSEEYAASCPRRPSLARSEISRSSSSTASAAALGSPKGTTKPHSWPRASSAAGGSGVVTTGTPRAMYSTTLVGRECRKFGSSCSRDRPASAPSSIGMAWSFGTKPRQRSRPAACAASISARARRSAGPMSSTVMPCGRSSRATSIMSPVPRSGDRCPTYTTRRSSPGGAGTSGT